MSGELTIPLPPKEDLGPAMRALSERQRAFVVAWFHTGNQLKAFRAAGYAAEGDGNDSRRGNASNLWNGPRIQAAIKEYAQEVAIGSIVPKALNALEQIIDDASHKDRAKAVGMVLDRTGMHAKSEHIVTKPAESREERILKIIRMCKTMGLDPRKFIGGAVDFVDADFEIIEKEEAKQNPPTELLAHDKAEVIEIVSFYKESGEKEPMSETVEFLKGVKKIAPDLDTAGLEDII